MAELRKIFYALAMVTLLAALSAPAFAVGPLRCDASGVTPPFIRTEGHTELTGEVVINCTGGVSTTPGNPVPRVNIRVRLTTNITSKLLGTVGGTSFNEVLLIIDEPNSGRYAPNQMISGQTGERPLLACGDSGAPDNSPSGPNVCEIVAPAHPSRTYDGVPNAYGGNDDGGSPILCGDEEEDVPNSGSFSCGRPNVFQGHQVTGNSNMVEFNGVPFDPPGEALFNSASSTLATPWVRTLRIVNLRTDANAFFVAGNNSAIPILADISFSGNTQAGIDDPRELVVAYATSGITGPVVSGTASFVQCVVTELPELDDIDEAPETLTYDSDAPKMFVRFGEGFAYAWKTQGWAQMQENSVIVDGDRRYNPGTFKSATKSGAFVRQNVPGGIAYHTESGFAAPVSPIGEDPSGSSGQNPPLGVGTVATIFTNQVIQNGVDTNITRAGMATNGTRLQVKFSNIPSGVTIYTPEVVYLTRKGTNVITGIAIINANVAPAVNNAFNAPLTPNPEDWRAINSQNFAVYEIMYADPFAEEDITIPIGLTTVLNLLPQTIDLSTTVNGGFAPAHTSGAGIALSEGDAKGQIPRFFENLTGGQTLFSIVKCNCNLLFPFVSNASGFDTGVAIANTSLSPTDPTFTQTLAQSGPIQFWYFQNGALARTECTNAATKGVCPGTTFVPSGGVMTFTLARGSNTWGLNGAPSGFSGYMIAKSGFQYCHGFAYFSDLDRAVIPGIYGTSVGYLALVMDPSSFAGQLSGGNIIFRNATPRTVNITADGLNN